MSTFAALDAIRGMVATAKKLTKAPKLLDALTAIDTTVVEAERTIDQQIGDLLWVAERRKPGGERRKGHDPMWRTSVLTRGVPDYQQVLAIAIGNQPKDNQGNPIAMVVGVPHVLLAQIIYGTIGAPLPRSAIWTSSNASVLTVAADGRVTPVAAGSATITCAAGGLSASYTQTVITGTPAVGSVDVKPDGNYIVAIGQTFQLTAKTYDTLGAELTGRTYNWSSADSGKVTVNGSGLVTGVAAGTVRITAQDAVATSFSDFVDIVVPAAATPTTVDVTPNGGSVAVGATLALTAATKDQNGNVMAGRTHTWSSTDASKATVNASGVVTPVAQGTVTIRATDAVATGVFRDVTITVTAAVGGGQAPSPTGRNPIFWSTALQYQWNQMKAAYDANPTSTKAARVYSALRNVGLAAPGSVYGDYGLQSAQMFQITGDTSFAALAYTKVANALATGNVDGNSVRSFGKYVVTADLIYVALSSAQRTNLATLMRSWADSLVGRNGKGSLIIRTVDTDNAVSGYGSLVIYDAWAVPENTDAGTLLGLTMTHPFNPSLPVGGRGVGASNLSTLRNTVRYWIEYATGATAGEWMESSEYNRETVGDFGFYLFCMRQSVDAAFCPEWDAFGDKHGRTQGLKYAGSGTNKYADNLKWGDQQNDDTHTFKPLSVFNEICSAAVHSKGKSNGPLAQQYALDMIDSLEAGWRSDAINYLRNFVELQFYMWDPLATASSGALPATTATVEARNANLGIQIIKRSNAMVSFRSHVRSPLAGQYDHLSHVSSDFKLYRNGEYAIDHLDGYGYGPLSAKAMNTLLFQGLPQHMPVRSVSYEQGTVAGEAWFAQTSQTSGRYKEGYVPILPDPFVTKAQTRVVYFREAATGYDVLVVWDDLDVDNPLVLNMGSAGGAYSSSDVANFNAAQARAGGAYAVERILYTRIAPTLTPGLAAWTTPGGLTVKCHVLRPSAATITQYASNAQMPDLSLSEWPAEEFTLTPYKLYWAGDPTVKVKKMVAVIVVGTGSAPAVALSGGNPDIITVGARTVTMNPGSIAVT